MGKSGLLDSHLEILGGEAAHQAVPRLPCKRHVRLRHLNKACYILLPCLCYEESQCETLPSMLFQRTFKDYGIYETYKELSLAKSSQKSESSHLRDFEHRYRNWADLHWLRTRLGATFQAIAICGACVWLN